MKNSVCKMFPLAAALLLALCGAAVAGDNANVVISLDSGEHADALAGEKVQVALSADGLVGVKQFEVTLTVSPPDAFDLEQTTFEPAFGYSPGVELLGNGQIKSGAATLNGPVNDKSALGVFILTARETDTDTWITVSGAAFGPSSDAQDRFSFSDAEAAELELRVAVNRPVFTPSLFKISPRDTNPYSAIGQGAVDDDSPGELAFEVVFADHKRRLTKGQIIAWDILNEGPESVYLLSGKGKQGVELPAGVSVSLRNVTDENGNSAIRFDSEGNLKAAPTSLTVRARTTTAMNSAGEAALDTLDFKPTSWEVPGGDQLMFVDQVAFKGVPLEDSVPGDVVVGIAGAGEVIAGPGERIPVVLSADGLVDAKQVEVTLTVSPPGAFNLAATEFTGSAAFSLEAPTIEMTEGTVQSGAAVTLVDGEVKSVSGDGVELGTFTLVTSSEEFNEKTEAEIVVHSVSLGSESGTRDYLDAESGLLDLRVHLNRPDPVLVATKPENSLGNVSLGKVWPVGNSIAGDEPSEIEYTVNFTNHWGARDLSADQLIVWDIFNRSMHSVEVADIGTIPSQGSVYVRNTTDAAGNASIEVDAAAEAFLSIEASTEIQNAAGRTLNLAVDFSAAWAAAAAKLAAVPLANSLSQNYPNPFNPETTIRYDLGSDAIVSLTIYNIAGQVVRKLVDGESLAAGQYQAVWDGRGESGARVASGMYFYLLHAGDYVAKRKMVLLR